MYAVSEKMVNIINHMKDGLELANTDRTNKIAMPDIYLGTPHTYHDTVKAADGADAENELIRKYRHVSEEIYNNLSREVGKDIITGIYYGREDPDLMRDESGNLSTSYKNMQSISQFAHEKGLKLFWSPYCINDTHWNQIGEIVNTGSFIGQDGNSHLRQLKKFSATALSYGSPSFLTYFDLCSKKVVGYAFSDHIDSNLTSAVSPNLLKRDFTASKPDTNWVGDITYIPTDEGWLYAAIVKAVMLGVGASTCKIHGE